MNSTLVGRRRGTRCVAAALFLTCALAAYSTGAAQKRRALVDVADLTEAQRAACIAHVKERGRPPIDYLVAKFAKHDVVLLGETHQIRQNCAFVRTLIDPLYRRAGVRVIATEFLRSRNNARVQTLVTAPAYDRALAMDLFRDGPWPTWGFQEYMDILEGVWRLNDALPEGAERMRVVGIDSDWDQHDLWFKLGRAERFKTLLAREANMVRVVSDATFDANRKALVHVGAAHSCLCHGKRLGTELKKAYGDRVGQVVLHHELGVRGSSPLTSLIESAAKARGGAAVGFDIAGSPFAELYDRRMPQFRALRRGLEGIAEGYVYLVPAAALAKTTWAPGFITEATFEKARDVAVRMRWVKKGQCASAAELDRALAARFPAARTPKR